jgi:diaminohydroxyphosphoribosylaminopyrimidine deaminase/5-amino-6-(5-phosphoribosylamino)uracil reductase
VVVGIGTVLADDPRLLPTPALGRPFHRIVLDSRLRLPPRSRLVAGARRAPVLVFCRRPQASRRAALEAKGVEVIEVAGSAGRLSLGEVLAELKRRGVWSVMVEGGAEVLGSFLREGLFDKVALFRAPLLLGGRDSLPAFGGPGPARLRDAARLRPAPPPASGLYELWYPGR